MAMTGKQGTRHADASIGSAAQKHTEAMIMPRQAAPHGPEALAVLYASGAQAPRITVTEGAAGVFTVRADGAPVAVVASLEAPRPGQIRVIERNPDGSVPALAGAVYLN